ncbi:MAG: ATP-binding protein [Nitrospira sp.]|nr:ATP-binding protein [Nitrospira sp.]MCW5778514.1 ATP-binding protein [Nitrospira sp.]
MTPEALHDLIAAGETLAVEFKGEEKAPLNDRELVETVVCLANRTGAEPGYLLVGVEDDGRITGARPRHGTTTDADRVAALIAGRTRPALSVSVGVVSLQNAEILAIEIPPTCHPIGTSDGVFLRRARGGGWPPCLPADGHSSYAIPSGRSGLAGPFRAGRHGRTLGRPGPPRI